MTQFSDRSVAVFDLPLPDGATILHPEQVVLRFGNAGTADIGALCYLRRGKEQRLRGRFAREVDLSSYSAERAENVRAVIEHISQESRHGGRRILTLKYMTDRLSNSFMDWADSNGHPDALSSKEAARTAFRGYCAYVGDRVGQNLISITTGAQYQTKVLALLSGLHESDDLHHGIRLLQQDNSSEAATSPPSCDDQSRVLAMCEALFDGLTELVLDGKSYPFKLAMPRYLNWSTDFLWVFPTRYWCMPPHALAVRHSMKYPYWKYDYANGRVTPRDELTKLLGYDGYGENYRATARVEEANANLDHSSRRQVGIVAHNAFVVLFAANTGMNRSQLLSLPWAGPHDIATERQGFRVIKWRANNRVCHFEIEASFLPRFRRFLELRKYLLSSTPYGSLFFTLGRHMEPTPGPMLPSVVSSFFELLRTLDPQLPTICFREWRAAKSDWLVRNTDPATAAMILQNSEQTVLKAYAAGSESVHRDEMSAFFASVRNTVLNRGEMLANSVDRAVGVCTSFGAPTSPGDGPITPDCRQVEGCLFCGHYKVHADECDTKKLLSCRYCLHQTSHLASSEEQFQQMFGPILERIRVLLDEINHRDPGLVDRLHVEVEAGDLDPYWASKMEMLINLEIAA